MASQKDLFDSDKDSPQRISSTHDPSKKKHEYIYERCILFDWKVNVPKPFDSYKLSLFNNKDLKKEWIQKNFGTGSRVTKLTNLSPFPGGVFSLFAKLELGMDCFDLVSLHFFYMLPLYVFQ